MFSIDGRQLRVFRHTSSTHCFDLWHVAINLTLGVRTYISDLVIDFSIEDMSPSSSRDEINGGTTQKSPKTYCATRREISTEKFGGCYIDTRMKQRDKSSQNQKFAYLTSRTQSWSFNNKQNGSLRWCVRHPSLTAKVSNTQTNPLFCRSHPSWKIRRPKLVTGYFTYVIRWKR